jgi:hypothetical protein
MREEGARRVQEPAVHRVTSWNDDARPVPDCRRSARDLFGSSTGFPSPF